MLELKGVHAHYGLSHVLQGIDLRVGKGEIIGLFGRNGVGKTTVIKTIAGWVAPSSGQVLFEGERLDGDLPARHWTGARRPKDLSGFDGRRKPAAGANAMPVSPAGGVAASPG